MAVDSSKLGDLCEYLHNLWSAPFQIVMAIYFLYMTLGASVFGGVGVLLIMFPVNGYLATHSRSLGKKQMSIKDSRTRLMDEVLNGIKVIKLNGWQDVFCEKIKQVRDLELETLRKMGVLYSFTSLTWSITPFLVSLVTFTIYSFTNTEPLTSTKIFVSLSLFNLLSFPLVTLPSVIAALVEASVSLSRLITFFQSEERDEYVLTSSEGVTSRIRVLDASFSWEKSVDANPVHLNLDNINLKVRDGQLIAIVGQVGVGKSSLLSALIGDMYKVMGSVHVIGKVAYVAQTAWILNATIRENIVFGHKFDQKWYEKVVSACGLALDLAQFENGDATEIGEKGINLSGGNFCCFFFQHSFCRSKTTSFYCTSSIL